MLMTLIATGVLVVVIIAWAAWLIVELISRPIP